MSALTVKWHVETLHDDCEACNRCAEQAVTMAKVTGSMAAEHREDHRDLRTLEVVIDHSAAVMRAVPDVDRCTACHSEYLFSGFFDAEGFARPDGGRTGDGTRWTTFCNTCGEEQ